MDSRNISEQDFPKKFGDYWLIRKIATGGMAEIFLARTHTSEGIEKYFALKMIHPRYLEEKHFHRMIVEEAKIAVQLHHKNVGQVFDLGCVDGRYFIVMEFIDGYDLSRIHQQCRDRHINFPIDVAAYIGREVCAALHYAHNLRTDEGAPLNLIHRDMSPQNILVSFHGDVKIIDFGIAKVSTQIQQTQVGVIKGKFYYMSPEQAGAADVDQRSDLFSLGICLWETVTGQSLFRREGGPTNPLAILHEIRTMPIPRVREYRRDCPAHLDDVIAQALSRDLNARYSFAAQMYEAFDRYLKRRAPHFNAAHIRDFMVRAYEKVETTKETARVTTRMFDLMQRGDFLPSEASVIFDVGDYSVQPSALGQQFQSISVKADSSTTIFDTSQPDITVLPLEADEILPTLDELPSSVHAPQPKVVISGVTEAATFASETTTGRDVSMSNSAELAVSDTVFLLADDVAEMERIGARPEVVESQTKGDHTTQGDQTDKIGDPTRKTSNADLDKTQALSLTEIQAAHHAFQNRYGAESNDISKKNIAQHPLFRWLVLAVLVMCFLVGTLALMLRQRGNTVAQVSDEVVQPERTVRSEARSTGGSDAGS